ncbi:MAG: hypothetical protein QOH90_1449 [Actinomycetota bacterium]|nr:hypothetical protein [Actinomycetota bacterium]
MSHILAAKGWKTAVGGLVVVAVAVGSYVATSAASPHHVLAAGQKGTGKVDPRQKPYFDPARFTTRIDNAWFPLKPGIRYIYRGNSGGTPMRDVFTVTSRTKVVDGVTTRVINDRVFSEGHLEERTLDYYVQDDQGNVWYFGEDTAELDRKGHVISTEGTWHAGRHGAEPGLFMEANPQPGNTYQQEFQRGVAEDHFTVLTLSASVKVPYGTFGRNALKRSVLVTKEWTPLEPKVRDHKVYVRGVGEVKEVAVKGPQEVGHLVKIVRV